MNLNGIPDHHPGWMISFTSSDYPAMSLLVLDSAWLDRHYLKQTVECGGTCDDCLQELRIARNLGSRLLRDCNPKFERDTGSKRGAQYHT